MKYEIKLKTGFFETTLYYLCILEDCIELVPYKDTAKDFINIYNKDIVSIQLTKSKHLEIEMRTRNQTFCGIFDEKQNLRQIHQELKKNIKSKIIYEEE